MKTASALILILIILAPAAHGTAVAFSAALSTSVTVFGEQTLVLDAVITNVGGAYDPSTGIFTCPDSGLYTFQFFAVTNERSYLLFDLVAGGDYVNSNWARAGSSQWETGANSAVLQLSAGEQVYLRSRGGFQSSVLAGADGYYTSFSGFKIFDMADCPAVE